MALLDSILNFAVLLLWLNWRSLRLDPVANSIPTTLAGTLKSTRPTSLKGWQVLAGLCLLLVLRVVVCEEIGSPVDWTPKLDLGFIALAFRSDNLATAVAYSLLSSLRLVVVFYFWLLALVAINRASTEPDPLLKLLRFHVGRVARWPVAVQISLPIVVAAGLWMALQPLLVRYHVVIPAASFIHLCAQGLLVGTGLIFSLKYLVPAILLLHLVSSYVYLGNNALWDFVSTSSRNLLRPLQGVPLRFARVDFAPIAAILLVLFLLHWLPDYLLRVLALHKLTLWPR